MSELRVKGRIAEVLEGAPVTRESLLAELRGLPETAHLNEEDANEMLKEMLEDGTVRRGLIEKDGSIHECWELT